MDIREIRAKYPQYSDISDEELLQGLHRKFYSDMPYADFAKKISGASTGSAEQGVSGFMRGLRDPLDAGAQALERMLPEGVVQKVNQFNNWLVDQGVPLERLGEAGLQGQLNELEQNYRARRIAEGEDPESLDWGRVGGNVAGAIGTGLAGRALAGGAGLAPAVTVPGRLAQGIGAGAAGGFLAEPLTGEQAGEDFWTEKAKQTGMGAAFGGALGTVGEAAGRIGRQVTRPEVERLRDIGVRPTVGQALGGMANELEQKAMSIPLVGDVIRGTRSRALEDFNIGALNEAVGGGVTRAGHEGMQQAQDIVSRLYDDAAALSNGIPVDNQTVGALNNLWQGVSQTLNDADTAHFDKIMQFVRKKLGNYPGLAREDFVQLDQKISELARSSQGPLRDAFKELRRTLLDQAERANPQYADAYRAARTAAARLMPYEEAAKAAVASTRSEPGVFTPGQALRGIRSKDISSRKRAIAAGLAPQQELGTAAQQVLGDTVPDSGTAGRLMASAGLGGGLGVGALGNLPGMLPLAALTGAAMGLGTRPGQAAILAALRSLRNARAPIGASYLGGQALGRE